MASYSFLDVTATITGPGGAFSIKIGAAPEGITWAPSDDMNEMVVGSDGTIQHSLKESGNTGQLTLTLLKVSHVNQQLRALFESQRSTASTWGMNTITWHDRASNEDLEVTEAAFTNVPNFAVAQTGGTVTWTFDGRLNAYNAGHAPGQMFAGRNV